MIGALRRKREQTVQDEIRRKYGKELFPGQSGRASAGAHDGHR